MNLRERKVDMANTAVRARFHVVVGCPHCGSRDGYYTVIIVRYDKYFTWGGEENGASEGKHVSGGKQARCESCNRIVAPNA